MSQVRPRRVQAYTIRESFVHSLIWYAVFIVAMTAGFILIKANHPALGVAIWALLPVAFVVWQVHVFNRTWRGHLALQPASCPRPVRTRGDYIGFALKWLALLAAFVVGTVILIHNGYIAVNLITIPLFISMFQASWSILRTGATFGRIRRVPWPDRAT